MEEKGAIMVGSDTSVLEVGPAPAGSTSFIPVHEYLLVEQGVHVAEFHYLEELAADGSTSSATSPPPTRSRAAPAGFTMRPLAPAIKIIHQGIHQGPKKTIHEGPRRTTKGH